VADPVGGPLQIDAEFAVRLAQFDTDGRAAWSDVKRQLKP
jgi:hypothetical protein